MVWRDASTESVGQIRDMTVIGLEFIDNEDGTGILSVSGSGGSGTPPWFNVIDYGAVGNGEWTIETAMYGGSSRPLRALLGTEYSTAPVVATLNSGDTVVVTIDDTSDGDCVRSTIIDEAACIGGGKWGFTQAVWVAA